MRDYGAADSDADIVDRALSWIAAASPIVDLMLQRIEVILIERGAEQHALPSAIDDDLCVRDHRRAEDALAHAHEARVVARVGVPLFERWRLEAAGQEQVA